ncbi:MAG: hypothetical protein K2G77_03620 [Muribaculaceae bacterium]|nr:hypothetical protein [Muribaculaceae bacterium]
MTGSKVRGGSLRCRSALQVSHSFCIDAYLADYSPSLPQSCNAERSERASASFAAECRRLKTED